MGAAGSFPNFVSLDAVATRAWVRLVAACIYSGLLHFILLVVVPVIPPGGASNPIAMLTARLEPAVADSEPAPEKPAPVAEPVERTKSAINPQKSTDSKIENRSDPPRAQEPISPPGGGIEVPFMRDPTYYPAKQLDVYPRPLTQIQLDYPASAVMAKVDGRLMVLLLIDEFGVVNDASVVESRPEGFFEDAALEVLRAARFTPAQKLGRPVKSRVLLQVNYSYGNSAGTLY
jgi:protein TonB